MIEFGHQNCCKTKTVASASKAKPEIESARPRPIITDNVRVLLFNYFSTFSTSINYYLVSQQDQDQFQIIANYKVCIRFSSKIETHLRGRVLGEMGGGLG